MQFHKKCISRSAKKGVNLAMLPPSDDAVNLHVERAFLQVQEWLGNALEPRDYGWKIKDGLLEPIPMQQDPAPAYLMVVIQCNCKATKCQSGRCSCYRSSQRCTVACGCQNCENQEIIEDENEESEGECIDSSDSGDESEAENDD